MIINSSQNQSNQENIGGRWSVEEHRKFLQAIVKFGKDWKNVEKVVKTRNNSQIRSHSQKFFYKLNNIQKERKKYKNFNLIKPTSLEMEILELFKQQNITKNTPIQISEVITKDWNAVAAQFNQKKLQKSQKIIEDNEGQKIIEEKVQEKSKNTEKKYQIKKNEVIILQNVSIYNQTQPKQKIFNFQLFMKQPNSDQSKILHKQVIINNQELSNNNPNTDFNFKGCFVLPNDQQNKQKLKQVLYQLYKNLGLNNKTQM